MGFSSDRIWGRLGGLRISGIRLSYATWSTFKIRLLVNWLSQGVISVSGSLAALRGNPARFVSSYASWFHASQGHHKVG